MKLFLCYISNFVHFLKDEDILDVGKAFWNSIKNIQIHMRDI